MTDISAPAYAAKQRENMNIRAWIIAFFTAGAAALLSFDIFGQVLSPLSGNATLAPVGLANSSIKAVFGSGYSPGAEALYYAAGLIAYPVGWALIGNPLRQRNVPAMHWMIGALLYGVALWVFALFVMAHLVGGMPAFLGWNDITWVALVGHIVYAVVFASVWHGLRPTK